MTNEIFENLSSGKFWLIGTVEYNFEKSFFLQGKPRTVEEIQEGGRTSDDPDAMYHFGVWDLTKLAGKEYAYLGGNDADHYRAMTLKPCLKQCMLQYLEPKEQEFLNSAFARAVETMKKYCEENYFHSFMLLTSPGANVGLHHHRPPQDYPSTAFTYVVSSGVDTPKTSLMAKIKDGTVAAYPYPDVKEFFFIQDAKITHGTRSSKDDQNHYLYFIFDGVTLKDPDTKRRHFYTP